MRSVFSLLSMMIALFSGATAHAETLTLGSVNDDVRKHIERFTPLANYLEDALADHGITHVAISVLPDSEAMAVAMREGDVDLYFDSPMVAAHVARLADGEPLLRRWKNGISTYHSVIVVPTNSPIASLDDLAGRTVGFQEPDSTSGFMLPAAMMRQYGLQLRELESPEAAPAETEAGYVFTGDDRNTVLWLARGMIDAGATDPRGLEWLQEARPDAFRVLTRSIDVPRQVVVRRSGMAPELAESIVGILSSMVETQAGIDTMEAFNDTTRFDEFPDGVDATFDPIYHLLDQLSVMGLI